MLHTSGGGGVAGRQCVLSLPSVPSARCSPRIRSPPRARPSAQKRAVALLAPLGLLFPLSLPEAALICEHDLLFGPISLSFLCPFHPSVFLSPVFPGGRPAPQAGADCGVGLETASARPRAGRGGQAARPGRSRHPGSSAPGTRRPEPHAPGDALWRRTGVRAQPRFRFRTGRSSRGRRSSERPASRGRARRPPAPGRCPRAGLLVPARPGGRRWPASRAVSRAGTPPPHRRGAGGG